MRRLPYRYFVLKNHIACRVLPTMTHRATTTVYAQVLVLLTGFLIRLQIYRN
jgi:hypothetical protein